MAEHVVLLEPGDERAQKIAKAITDETDLIENSEKRIDDLKSMAERIKKGIISKIIEGKKRIYQLQKPESLIEYIQKKKSELETQENIAKQLAKDVDLAKKHIHSPETAMVYIGIAGVKQIYSEIVEEKLDYLVFGSPKESEMIGEYYWKNLHAKQKEYGIKAKMIFHKSLKNWKTEMPKKLVELKFLKETFEPLTETTIYGNKVAFVVWTEKPVITIISNEHVANSYRQVFDILWRQAEN